MDQGRFKAIKIIMQRAQVNNCPVAAVKTTIYRDSVSGRKVFVNEFVNHGERTVCSMSVKISCFDEQIKLVGTIKDYQYRDLNVAMGEEFGQNKLIACPNDSISSFAVSITHVEFENDYYWDETTRRVEPHEPEVAVEMAPEIPEEPVEEQIPETIDEGIFMDTMSREENVSITAMFGMEQDERTKTPEVEVPEEPIQTAEPTKSAETVEMPDTAGTTDTPKVEKPGTSETTETIASAETSETTETATAKENSETSVTTETTETPAGEGENLPDKKKKKKMPKAVKIAITLLIIVILAVIAVVALDKYKKYSEYNRGAAYMANGNYEYAINAYTRLGNYLDAPVLLVEAKKAYAGSLYDAGQFEQAIEEYQKLGNQDEKILECYNGWALSLCEQQQYIEALRLIQDTSVAFDEDVVKKIQYQYGASLYEYKEYEGAIRYLSEAKGYEDSQKLLEDSYYQYGMKLAEVGDYERALESFSKVKEYKDSAKRMTELNYLQGKRLKDSGALEDAIQYFESVIEYEDSAVLIKECYYTRGMNYLRSLEYEKAMEDFEKADDYEGAKEQYYEALYQSLLKEMETEVTLETMDKLAQLPKDYKDTATIIKTLKKYVEHVGSYQWTTSNDKDINSKGGFEDPIIVKLTYKDGEANLTVDGNPVDLKLFVYKSGTDSNTYSMLNTKTITRTFNGKIHTYKKIIEE